MKTLIETTDRSLVESLRLALEGEGIDAQVLDVGTASLPFVPICVRVLRDEDFELAENILKTLQRTSRASETPPVVRRTTRLLLALLANVAIACLCL